MARPINTNMTNMTRDNNSTFQALQSPSPYSNRQQPLSAWKWLKRSVPQLLNRLTRPRQMDWDQTKWQLRTLITAPRSVYRNLYFHKQTTNQWHRTDPAFSLVVGGMVCACALMYGVGFGMGFVGTVNMVFWMVLLDFLLCGIVVSSAFWLFTNRYLNVSQLSQNNNINNNNNNSGQVVEWLYCWDVHCNAFVPVILILYVLQLILYTPLLSQTWFISRLIGNSLYLIASMYYVYITFLGYAALPFLHNCVVVLYPSVGVIIVYLMSLLTSFNMSQYTMSSYLHS